MDRINVKKFGIATGLTGAILYMGCMIIMITVGKEGTVLFFNSLIHGLDTTTIIRMDVPLLEAFFGIIQTFILGWLMGACIGVFYNVQFQEKKIH
jgi:hypothetical protein